MSCKLSSIFGCATFVLSAVAAPAASAQEAAAAADEGKVDEALKAEISYVETLRVYLECNASVSKAASALYVHRSTLMERLQRIRRELDVDLDDPDVQLHLRLLLKALQMQARLQG